MEFWKTVSEVLSSLRQCFGTIVPAMTGGQRGQTLVEYSLILAFVATMILAISVMVGGTNGLIGDIESELNAALGLGG